MKRSLCFIALAVLLSAAVSLAAADGLSLPADTQVIEDEAFRQCESLTGTAVIPDGVTSIGAYAFAGCTGLTGVPVIPASVKYIGPHAFDGCTGLSGTLYLPSGTEADETAFDNCPGLTVAGDPAHMSTYIMYTDVYRDGSVDVTWAGIDGASDYTLYYAREGEDFSPDMCLKGITGTTAVLKGLEFRTDYVLVVTATVGGVETGMSSAVHFTTRGIVYRALLIGEVHFDGNEVCNRNEGDCDLMYGMLTSRFTPIGTQYETPAKYTDKSADEILSLIGSTFADANEDDVSLFFIATHGDSETTYEDWEEATGSLYCTDSAQEGSWLDMGVLAEALGNVPGEVIVVLESCGSGAAVYDPEHPEEQNSVSRGPSASDMVSAFPAETLILTDADRYVYDEEGNGQPVQGRIGEFRVADKFYVLCASRYLQESWGTEGDGTTDTAHNYFTLWLTEGVGTYGSIPADSDGDGILTLSELFGYISNVGDDHIFVDYQTQQVQVYPTGSDYALFMTAPLY